MSNSYAAIPTDHDDDESHDVEQDQGVAERSRDSGQGEERMERSVGTKLPSSHSQPRRRGGPSETALHVDERFRLWTTNIANKLKIKKRKKKKRQQVKLVVDKDAKVDIMVSVFDYCPSLTSAKGKERAREIQTLDHGPPMDRETFDQIVLEVKTAIEQGVEPRLNSKGSSGSYFARDPHGTTVGIFKPKDEEPYGRLNPKLTKWIHRNFLASVIPFGRSCLIPQLSYLSEAAASLLDRRLLANIVPRTEVVSISSPAFYYDWIDRERARAKAKGGKGRKLPDKAGSFQIFLRGFQDASLFLRNHPYPGRPLSQTLDVSSKRKKRLHPFAMLNLLCGRAGAIEDDDEEQEGPEEATWGWGGEDGQAVPRGDVPFKWTHGLMNSFREELEKLVILDYLMRNTDRGLDNFMLKWCPGCSEESGSEPHMHLAAIDNSLSFPHQHPKGWRSYTYGWLYLPVSAIGNPFSTSTRAHYLPLLSSPVWWAETTLELRKLFSIDKDFKEKMFLKQMAVIKGQAYNIVTSLKNPSDGPLELCRRPKRLVWDELIEVADDDVTRNLILATSSPLPPLDAPTLPHASSPLQSPPPFSPQMTSSTIPIIRPDLHSRHFSSVSSVLSASQAIDSLTGVNILQHLDRVDAEERDFRKSFGMTRGGRRSQDDGTDDEGVLPGGGGESWGVQSESDMRYGAGRRSLQFDRRTSVPNGVLGDVGGKNTAVEEAQRRREAFSFDVDRALHSVPSTPMSESRSRQRSGSMSHLVQQEEEEGSGRVNGHSKSASSRPSYPVRTSGGDWFDRSERRGLVEEDEDEEEDGDEGEPAKKVVVVERMEVIAEAPPLFKLC